MQSRFRNGCPSCTTRSNPPPGCGRFPPTTGKMFKRTASTDNFISREKKSQHFISDGVLVSRGSCGPFSHVGSCENTILAIYVPICVFYVCGLCNSNQAYIYYCVSVPDLIIRIVHFETPHSFMLSKYRCGNGCYICRARSNRVFMITFAHNEQW